MKAATLFFVLMSSIALAQTEGVAPAGPLQPAAPGLGESAWLTWSAASEDSTAVPVGIEARVFPTEQPGRYRVVPVRVGRVGVVLPRGGGVADTLRWDVAGQIPEGAQPEARPLQGVGIIRPNWLPTLGLALAVLAIPLFFLWRWQRRRRRRASAFPLLAEPAHRLALQRLQEIEGSDWLTQGEFDRYYVEASHAFRNYVAGRYRVPALDWTSDEMVQRMTDAGYDGELVSRIHPMLVAADHVKFAGNRPSVHRAQEWLTELRDWVLETKIEPRFTTPQSVAAAQELTGGATR